MIPQILFDLIKSFNDFEIAVACETLKTLYEKDSKYPFNAQKSNGGEWCKLDLLHYLQQIDFDSESTRYMVILGIFSTIIIQRKIYQFEK